MYKTIILFAVLAATLLSSTDGYTDCGSTVGTVEDVVISNCVNDNSKRCILKRNSNVSIAITFKSGTDTDSVKAVVHGIIAGAPIPFSIPNPDGCKDSGVECPVKNGQTYVYDTILPVLAVYPRITVDVKWELKNANDEDLVCILIRSKLA